MLAAIRDFFEHKIAAQSGETTVCAEQRARLAAAALLVEVARSDQNFSEPERRAVLESVQRRFDLGPAQARQLLALAEAQSREAHDLFQFTSRINATFAPERKAQLIEELWRAAYSDGVLNEYEEHMIRRVADLLHVPHSGFIAAKLRVLAARERGN
jgi:uncharacterized tellurite resistance protein B-like protein